MTSFQHSRANATSLQRPRDRKPARRAHGARDGHELGDEARERMVSTGLVMAGVVHEVSNVLTVIGGSLDLQRTAVQDLLQRGDLPQDAATRLRELAQHDEMAGKALTRMKSLLTAVRDTSRAPHGRRRPVDVDAFVQRMSDLARSRFPAHAHVEFDLRAMRPAFADETAVSQVLLNILLNAADAVRDSAEPRLSVRTRDLGGREASILIEVEDNGPGMSKRVAAQVMKPFFTTKETGTGLGLNISRRITEEQGGQLTFTTKEGVGTTFFLRLPQADPPERRRARR